jgi:hypothetical protein
MRQYNTSNETWSETHMDDPRFYKHDDGCCFIKTSYHDGVLPAILGKLATARKAYKKEMMRFERLAFDAVVGSKERAEFEFMEKNFNARQLAAKAKRLTDYAHQVFKAFLFALRCQRVTRKAYSVSPS